MIMYALNSLCLLYAPRDCLKASEAVKTAEPKLNPKMTLAMFISVSPGTSFLYHGGIRKPVMLPIQPRTRIDRV
jgi:hypothetical protein